MNKLLKLYGFGWLYGICLFVLFELYWTLRRGEFIVREPNLFILWFEIANVMFAMWFLIYITNKRTENGRIK